jgi:hypothetical protein
MEVAKIIRDIQEEITEYASRCAREASNGVGV